MEVFKVIEPTTKGALPEGIKAGDLVYVNSDGFLEKCKPAKVNLYYRLKGLFYGLWLRFKIILVNFQEKHGDT